MNNYSAQSLSTTTLNTPKIFSNIFLKGNWTAFLKLGGLKISNLLFEWLRVNYVKDCQKLSVFSKEKTETKSKMIKNDPVLTGSSLFVRKGESILNI